ncbi:programmed cell death protein 1-like [Erythrolamprus reginae]|uniref:programmed cell death protein 1-like n=1 Tax=Erythrolamprus reginae TaxID=121349 RepID=UPI00396CDB1B
MWEAEPFTLSPPRVSLPLLMGLAEIRFQASEATEGRRGRNAASENPSKGCQLFGVTMEEVFYVLLGFLFCSSALQVKPSVYFYPPQLNLTEGETATFTCSMCNPGVGKHLLWYKQGHDHQPVKLDSGSPKYRFYQRDNCRYEMEIREVEKNDSGIYYCWVNPFHPQGTMLESNRSKLIVTEKLAATRPPDKIPTRVKEQGKGIRKASKSSFSNLRGSGLFILLVALYFSFWIIRRRRQKRKEQKQGKAPLDEVDPPSVAVFTVDYEMLAFPGGAKTKPPASPKPVQREPTEYATIVFLPSKTPEDAEAMDSQQTTCPVCVQHS